MNLSEAVMIFDEAFAAMDVEMMLMKEEVREENRYGWQEPLHVLRAGTGVRKVNTRPLGRPNRCLYARKGQEQSGVSVQEGKWPGAGEQNHASWHYLYFGGLR